MAVLILGNAPSYDGKMWFPPLVWEAGIDINVPSDGFDLFKVRRGLASFFFLNQDPTNELSLQVQVSGDRINWGPIGDPVNVPSNTLGNIIIELATGAMRYVQVQLQTSSASPIGVFYAIVI
jgi:hypothetical protein